MTKFVLLFEVGSACPDLADEIQALLKRLDKAGEFTGPAQEANGKRFAKLCRDALQMGAFPKNIQDELEAVASSLLHAGRPAMEPDEKRKNRSFKASDDEWMQMGELAKEEGVKVSEFIRRKTLG